MADEANAHSGSSAELYIRGKDVSQLSFLHRGTASEIGSTGIL